VISSTHLLVLGFAIFATFACAGATKVVSGEPAVVFSGGMSSTEVRFQNSEDTAFEAEVFMRLFQLSSATAMPVTEAQRWNKLAVLPHQTVVEQVEFRLPGVRAETMFEMRWSDGTGAALGSTVIKAFPTNLLAQFNDICGEHPLGIYDPGLRLKPLLALAKVAFIDVEQAGLQNFQGRLLIVFANEATKPSEDFRMQMSKVTGRGVRLIWLSSKANDVNVEKLAVLNDQRGARWAVVHPNSIAGLNTNVASQLRLLSIARLVTSTNRYELNTTP